MHFYFKSKCFHFLHSNAEKDNIMALESITLFQNGLLLVVLLSAPALLAAVIFGVMISLVQTLIQVQDQTLPFAIKLVAVGVALFATGGWIASEMINLANTAFNQIIYMQ